MDLLHARPLVFLSHSKSDIAFVKQLYEDLGHCQIRPCLDSVEKRHGQPWLDAIFESGIPRCDCVLVYLTPESIGSPMVKKEIDASIIRKLQDEKVAFLPYISDSHVRRLLRPDIQSLQIPVWNSGNYQELLPRVVAEIWRSFMERNLRIATNGERAKRLEAELALERARSDQEVFSSGEQKDFSFIHNALNRGGTAMFVMRKGNEVVRTSALEFNVLAAVLELAGSHHSFSYSFPNHLVRLLEELDCGLSAEPPEYLSLELKENIQDGLEKFGLLRQTQVFERSIAAAIHQEPPTTSYKQEFTDKMQRFRYWLAFTETALDELELKPSHSMKATE